MLWDNLAILFSEMGLPAAVCLTAGLGLCILEIFNSFKGRLAALGAGLMLTGIIVRMCNNGTPVMLFWMLFIIGAVITGTYLLMIRIMRYNWLTHTPAIQGGIPDEAQEGRKDYYYLLGREGFTITELSPDGTILVDNSEVSASAKFGGVSSGERVRVIEVDNDGRVLVAAIVDR